METFGWQGILWILTNIVTLVIGFFKFQQSYMKFKTETEIRIAELEARIEEVKTDQEDHKLAFETRFANHKEEIDKCYDNFHDENANAHSEILSAINFIKDNIGKVREDVSYMKGTLDLHLKTHAPNTRKR